MDTPFDDLENTTGGPLRDFEAITPSNPKGKLDKADFFAFQDCSHGSKTDSKAS